MQQIKKKAKAEGKTCHAKTMLSLEQPIKLLWKTPHMCRYANRRGVKRGLLLGVKTRGGAGPRYSNKPERGNLLTYSDLFMVSPTYQLIWLILTVREQQVHPTLWESTYEITITENALALLLPGPVGDQRLETGMHRTVKVLSLHVIVFQCFELPRHPCTQICKPHCDVSLLFLSSRCQPTLCRGYHPLLLRSLRCQRHTHVSVCSILLVFGTFRVTWRVFTWYSSIRHQSRTWILWS